MTPEEEAEWFLSWCNPYGAAKNTRRDITTGLCGDEAEIYHQEAVLAYICNKHPEVAYLQDQYYVWKEKYER